MCTSSLKAKWLPLIGVYAAIIILSFVHPIPVLAVPPVTKYLGIKQGLSNNSIRSIYQDHNGFIWVGTFDGLNRYDGYNFKIFRNKLNDSASLPHNYINAIAEDHHNNIWIGTGQGVSIYNSLTSKFLMGRFVPYGSRQKERIPYNINTIKTDAKGNLFLGTNGGGLLVLANGSDAATQLDCARDAKGVCRNDVQSIVIDKRQRVWLFVRELGLCLYDEEIKGIRLINSDLKSAACMEIDDEENLWIGTVSGLFKYNTQTHTFQNIPGKLTSNAIASLTLDHEQNLWIGTVGGGINIINTATEELSYLLPGKNTNSLSSEDVFAIYEDNESRKWIGTLKGGINIIDPQKSKFQTITRDPLSQNSLVSNFISAFYEDKNQDVWIGTDGGGISAWNRKQNGFRNFRHIPGSQKSLSNNSVPSFQEDYLGNFWIATFGGGINKVNKASGTFEHYACVNDLTGEEYKYVWVLYEDREKNLWATTYGNGLLFRLNRSTNRFEVFCRDPVDIYSLFEDHTGTLWAGTPYGLFIVDKQKKTYTRYNITKPVRAILEDKKGRLWIGTEGIGLNLFDRAKGQVVASYTDAEGLCNNAVLNILEDNKGHLWLSTFHGLSAFNPADKKFKNYYESDGLQSNQFSYNAALRLRSGELIFGGVAGFTIFNPDSLQRHTTTPSLFLTGLRINNQPVTFDSKYVSKTNTQGIQKVVIPYDEAVLAIDFTALEYSMPEKINYAYYMEAWDKGWNNAGSSRTANYTRLKEGTYHLRIKNTNAAGKWNPNEVTLQIVVLPPWYRSWWAYLIYIACAISLVYLFLRYRNRQNKLEYEIKLAQIEVQKEKEISEQRFSLFTDISHEFRTPLTLIINPVKDMLEDPEKRKDTNMLNAAYHNARRLLSLVNQLLLFRKAETSGNHLKINRLDFCSLCYEVYLSFVQETRSTNVDYQYTCPPDISIYGDRQKVEIALYNLLSNAVKYTPAGGKILFEVTENDSEVMVTVTDSGPGIPENIGNKIFDKFYQATNRGSVSKPGFGIGLSLVKTIAESHHGNIRYTSQSGQGAIFTLTFLKGKEIFKDYFISEEEETSRPGPIPEQAFLPAVENAPPDKMDDIVSDLATILVAEDDQQFRKYLVNIFSPKYKMYEASNAEQALLIAREQLPDLIISDNVMGEMTGMELCQLIKKDSASAHIPVIIITGAHSPEGRVQGMEYGADDYIGKPFEKDFLLAKVANLLQTRSVLQNYFYNEITLQKHTLKVSEEYKVFLENCIAIVEKHIDDEDFSIKILATEIGMSRSKIYRIVKSISGNSVNAFIRFIRLRRAAELLINTSMNVNEASYAVGINDVRYFRLQFNKLFGMNPSDYIKKYRKAFSAGYRVNKDMFKNDNP